MSTMTKSDQKRRLAKGRTGSNQLFNLLTSTMYFGLSSEVYAEWGSGTSIDLERDDDPFIGLEIRVHETRPAVKVEVPRWKRTGTSYSGLVEWSHWQDMSTDTWQKLTELYSAIDAALATPGE